MAAAVLTISARIILVVVARLAALQMSARVRGNTVSVDDPSMRAELLLLSPSFIVPSLEHLGARIWDTLAIASI